MKNKKLKPIHIIIGIIICALIAYFFIPPPSYSKIMTKEVKKIMGKDFKDYSGPSFPTNNFGILTTYENAVTYKNQLCAMAECFDSLILRNENDTICFGGLADVGQGPPVLLDEKIQRSVSVMTLLPELFKSVGLDLGLDKKEVVDVVLTFGTTYERHLNRIKFNDFVNRMPDNSLYKRKYLSGNLVVIVADVVVRNMQIKISLKGSTAIKLDTKISSGIALTNDTLKGEFKRLASGQYSFKTSQPLIILRLAKKQPQAGTLGKSENFDDWKPVADSLFKLKVKYE